MKTAALNLEVLSLAVLSVVLTLLPVFAPVEGFFLTTLAPFPLVVLAVRYPWRCALSVMALEVGCLLFLGGVEVLLLFSQYGLVPLIMAWAIRRGCGITQTVMWSVGIPVGIGGLLLGLYSISVQQTPYRLLSTYLEQVMAAFQDHVQLVEPGPGIDAKQFKAFVAAFSQLILTILPALVIINHLLTDVVNYVLVRYYCRRSRPPKRLDPESLVGWRASDYLVWVFLGSGVALLLPITAVSAVGLNVFLVTLSVYFLQGFAIAMFWWRRLPLSLGLRLLLILMVVLIAGPLWIGLCIAAGLFDLWIDFRRQRSRSCVP